MSKLTSKKLRQLILREFQKMEEDSLRMVHDDPGRQSYVSSKGNICHECGYMMKEDDAVCEQCGSMYEENLNEGNCGCGPSTDHGSGNYEVLDYDTDNDFVPDHMEHEHPNMDIQNFSEADIESLILNAITSCFLLAILNGFSKSSLIKSERTKQILLFFITELKYSRALDISVPFPFGLNAISSLIILRI